MVKSERSLGHMNYFSNFGTPTSLERYAVLKPANSYTGGRFWRVGVVH